MPRQPNGHAAIYPDGNGRYETYVSVTLANGTKSRKHVRGRTAGEVAEKVDEIKERIRRRAGIAPGKVETVGQWLVHWNDTIVKPNRSWNYWNGNRSMIETHLIPHLGEWRLDGRDRIEPEHVSAMLAALRESGLSGKHIQNVFGCLKQAMKAAVRQHKAPFSACDMLDRPESRRKKIRPLKTPHAQGVIREAMKDERLAVRWLFGIILGIRQGETLGLRWCDIHLDPDGDELPFVEVRRQTQRHTWEHGCDDPVKCVADRKVCNRKQCRTWEHGCGNPDACTKNRSDRCPQRRQRETCPRHPGAKGCPPPCEPGCTKHASTCKQRKNGGLVDADVKTEASEDGVPLGVLTELVRTHRERQIKAFADAGLSWSDQGFVFVRWIHDRHGNLVPRRLDPRQDHAAWEALLVAAAVPDARLHAMRHTSGTVSLAAGTPLEVVSKNLRHASIAITDAFYVQTAMELKRDAVNRVAAALMDGSLADLLRTADIKIG